MKAIVYTKYGSPADVLQLKDVEKPTPKDNQVLIKVHATSINAAESLLINGDSFLVRMMAGGLQKPKNLIPGADVAGRVESVGKNITQFKPGDEVFGDLSGCGGSAFAEYVCATENALTLKSANMTFAAAAAVPLAGITALQGLRDHGKLQAGQKVLITGASGGVGTFAVQFAKAFGAEVTGVCSTKKVDLVRSLGADAVIDYKHEDPTQNGVQYDLIFDIAAYRPFLDYRRSLTPNGKYLLAGGALGRIFRVMLQGPLVSMTGSKKFSNFMANPNSQDLAFMRGLIEAGKVAPVVDKCYPLSEIAEAFRYFDAGHAQGKIVITVAQ